MESLLYVVIQWQKLMSLSPQYSDLADVTADLFPECVVGRLYSIQYMSIFGMPDKVRRNTCEEARPSRLNFQRDEVNIHHVIALMRDCWS
jgi:hypothetical protein